jgi:hypothetical protein
MKVIAAEVAAQLGMLTR